MNSILAAIPLSPVALNFAGMVLGLLVFATLLTEVLYRFKICSEKRYTELRLRTFSWWVLVAVIILPIALGKYATILAVLILCLACFREFSRATGLFRETLVCALVVVGICLVHAAAVDHWYGFFTALASLSVITIAAIPILQDRPHGYIQRTGLGIFGFMFFGYAFGHLAYIANDTRYQEILLMLIFLVEGNDIAAYICGSLFGKRKLSPNTSPGKTVAGALGAVLITSGLTCILGRIVFAGTAMESPFALLLLGVLLSVTGQLGDLMLSSIKRDIGVKDLGAVLPGHGGFLDRFDSLTLSAPAFFHFVGFVNGFGLDQPIRIFSGNW
jgi:phosphatidate cytidylyltransferase